VADPQHAGARGAAYVASLALGRATPEELTRRVKIESEFTPNPANRATYEELFAEFKKLYKATKPIHARLNAQH